MALQLGALREALLHPGDPDLAAKAAEELAAYDTRLNGIDTKLAVLLALVTTLTGLALGSLWLSFSILSRLPR